MDESYELAENLGFGPVLLKDVGGLNGREKEIIGHILERTELFDWPLEKANEEARKLCSKALESALRYAKDVHDEHKEEGRDNGKADLDDSHGFGDEEVTDKNREMNDQGAATYQVSSMHFADPYGCDVFTVVKLTIKVEVVSKKQKGKGEAGKKRKAGAAIVVAEK